MGLSILPGMNLEIVDNYEVIKQWPLCPVCGSRDSDELPIPNEWWTKIDLSFVEMYTIFTTTNCFRCNTELHVDIQCVQKPNESMFVCKFVLSEKKQ